jgi:hypothetical protein
VSVLILMKLFVYYFFFFFAKTSPRKRRRRKVVKRGQMANSSSQFRQKLCYKLRTGQYFYHYNVDVAFKIIVKLKFNSNLSQHSMVI